MNKKTISIIAIAIFVLLALTFFVKKDGTTLFSVDIFSRNVAAVAVAVKSPFLYGFSVDGTLNESSNMDETTSPYWWLNSGGQMILIGGVGKTVHDELPERNKWRLAYSKSNPIDTDNGYHPQNIFRLLTRSVWSNYTQEAYFKIEKSQLSSSSNRNESNGLLLMTRYKDNNNLYYLGIRVDGRAIIKKKLNGTYYTMLSSKILSGLSYNHDTNPNLLPINKWIGIRNEIKTLDNNTVSIKLYTDIGRTGNWTFVGEVIDDGKKFGGPALTNAGYTGIRTDFMDVTFDDYRIVNK